MIMGMEIITGHTGKEHVRSEDDASLYKGLVGEYGSSPIILDTGELLRLEIINNNTVRILDGDVILNGHHARIRKDDYEDLSIDNGESGRRRTDAVMLYYERDNGTGIEKVGLKVVKGEPEFNNRPTPVIRDNYKEYPLYFIEIEGLSIKRVVDNNVKILSLKELHDFYSSRVIFESGEIKDRNGVLNKGLGDNSKTTREQYRWVKFADGTLILTGRVVVPIPESTPREDTINGFNRYIIGDIYLPDVVKGIYNFDINTMGDLATITTGIESYEDDGGNMLKPLISEVSVYTMGQSLIMSSELHITFKVTGNWKDLEEVGPFHSVSNSKALIAAAITDMGVSTSSSASYETMAENIRRIESGGEVTSGLDTSLISSTNGMFRNSGELELNLSIFDTSKVTDMAYMFENARARDLNLSSFDTSSVKDMRAMFLNSKAKSINVSSLNTSKVYNMQDMFKDMENLMELDVSSFDTSDVDSMQGMFSGLRLETLDLSNFDMSDVIFASYMFSNAEIDSLNIPFNMGLTNNNWEMFMNFKGNILQLPISMEIDGSMFNGAEVSELDFSNTELVRASSLTNLFRDFKGNSVVIPNWGGPALELLWGADSMFENANINELVIGELDLSNANSAEGIFRNAKLTDVDLSGVTFPEGSLSFLFEGLDCNALVLPYFGGTVYMSSSFKNSRVESVVISGDILGSANEMFKGFEGDRVKINFNEINNSIRMFEGANVDVIDMSELSEDSIDPDGDIYGMFIDCTASKILVGNQTLKDMFEFNYNDNDNMNPNDIPVIIV